MTSQRLLSALFLSGCLGITACAEEQENPSRSSPEAQAMREQALQRRQLESVEVEAGSTQGEVPAGILGVLRKDLTQRPGSENAELVLAEAVNWPNGALGCPRPGQMYTQVIVPGYRVVFENPSNRWDYRVSNTGGFILCDRNLIPGPGGGNPKK